MKPKNSRCIPQSKLYLSPFIRPTFLRAKTQKPHVQNRHKGRHLNCRWRPLCLYICKFEASVRRNPAGSSPAFNHSGTGEGI